MRTTAGRLRLIEDASPCLLLDRIRRCVCLLAGCWMYLMGTAQAQTVTVLQVKDGDGCLLEDGRRVRYLGMNAPETGDPHAEQATRANNALVGGKTVRLEFSRPRQDDHGRMLAYVFVDETFVNEALVRRGHAHLSYPIAARYLPRLCQAQDEARAAGLGIWAKAAVGADLAIVEVHADAEGNDRHNLNDEFIALAHHGQTPINLTGWTVSDTANHRYLFPGFTLAAEARVILRTGLGKSTETELFWGSRSPIWNNTGDTIFIRDDQGNLMLSHVYSSSRGQSLCSAVKSATRAE